MAPSCTPCKAAARGHPDPPRGQPWGHSQMPHGDRISPHLQGQPGAGADLGVPRRGGGLWGHQFLEFPVTHRSRPGATGAAVAAVALGAGQRHKPPASRDPSPRHRGRARGGPRCTRTCRLIAGDQRLPVILGTCGDGLTPRELGSCVALFSPRLEGQDSVSQPPGSGCPFGDAQTHESSVGSLWW